MKHGIVGDCGRDAASNPMATAGLTTAEDAAEGCRGADGRIIDLAAEDVHRKAHVVEANITFEGVTGAAIATVS